MELSYKTFLSREFFGFVAAQVSDRGGDGRAEDVREKRERIRAVYRARNRFALNLPQTLLHYSEFFLSVTCTTLHNSNGNKFP